LVLRAFLDASLNRFQVNGKVSLMEVPTNQFTNVWDIVLEIASIFGSLATIILGSIAIWLSLYFYRRSNEIYVALLGILSRVEASSKTTEVTSTQVTSRLIDGVLGSLQKGVLDKAEHPAMLRISERIDRALQPLPAESRQHAIKEIKDELEELFLGLKAEAAPTALDYDWGPFVRRINELENEHKFLSVKWLNETKFATEPAMQEALQIAIKDRILELYSLENPKNPSFLTTACKLAKQHPIIKKVLG
jgi:hypothetical protein